MSNYINLTKIEILKLIIKMLHPATDKNCTVLFIHISQSKENEIMKVTYPLCLLSTTESKDQLTVVFTG